jgi:ferrous iron transport protein A
MTTITLDKLAPGESGRITKVFGKGPVRRRLVDMGLTNGVVIEMIKISPLGDPVEYRLRGYHLSLRRSEANFIEVELIDSSIPHQEVKHSSGSTLLLVGCRSGKKVVISGVRCGRKMREKFKELGLIPGADIQVINNDFPGPLIISINDKSRLVLGRGKAFHIIVKPS